MPLPNLELQARVIKVYLDNQDIPLRDLSQRFCVSEGTVRKYLCDVIVKRVPRAKRKYKLLRRGAATL